MDFIERREILKLQKTKKIIGFGAGIIGAKTIAYTDNAIEYFVDNSELKIGKPWQGYVDIRPVSDLSNEDPRAIVIIVCSEAYALMKDQLDQLVPGLEIYISPLLKDYEVFDRVKNSAENLLISAYGVAGGLYLLNTRTEKYVCIKSGSFRGMTNINGKILVGTEDGNILEISSLQPFDCKTVIQSSVKTQLHGMAYWEKGNMLIVAEAFQDKLSFYNADDYELIDTYFVSEKSKKNLSGLSIGVHHINDLLVIEDTLLFCMISYSSLWSKGIYDGVILQLDLEVRKKIFPVVQGLLFPHSMILENNNLFFLESMTGELRDGNKNSIMQFPGFIRGLVCQEGLYYIGQARNRRIHDAKRYMQCVSIDSGIYIAEPKYKLSRFIKFPDMCDIYNLIIYEQPEEN